MAYKRKSWQEKLADSKGLPKSIVIPAKMVGKWGTTKAGDTMVIPAPIEVDAIMKKVPKGRVITIPYPSEHTPPVLTGWWNH
ncbi:MAG: hypothetical protein QME51_07535, partial [Planctomycetota bacterium]|nr:hypothetical protein [Planctomycetota bacterium]MDI6788207.1 hypothetical protein [Planctomycetota bacterium]